MTVCTVLACLATPAFGADDAATAALREQVEYLEAERARLARLLVRAESNARQQFEFRRALERELVKLRTATKTDCANHWASARYGDHANETVRQVGGRCN